MKIGRNAWLGLGGVLMVALLAWAWIDGGLRPLRPLSEPVVIAGVSR